jgi:hypothetical protein
MKATNWQAHSVRGFVSRMLTNKMGLNVESTENDDGERYYRIAGKYIHVRIDAAGPLGWPRSSLWGRAARDRRAHADSGVGSPRGTLHSEKRRILLENASPKCSIKRLAARDLTDDSPEDSYYVMDLEKQIPRQFYGLPTRRVVSERTSCGFLFSKTGQRL